MENTEQWALAKRGMSSEIVHRLRKREILEMK
jgi:hypothetical protein